MKMGNGKKRTFFINWRKRVAFKNNSGYYFDKSFLNYISAPSA
ncbi:hypothetical protein LEP1GSC062_2988 [Leptospira alexanderi serovar Manhao 3 str. L 60]|uniref:Uncharacterized protein n=1 Tax=Leptospira alexanderi serovar Manhao 3 str. L 60 TaxID=1049759 RepID=V6I6H6_9LEPT|nr:hypothetical protein LEP1GSC062_2988 [Leptospira alexanderi serovar Manhao 3 str. L 60]